MSAMENRTEATPLWVPMLVALFLPPVGLVWGGVMLAQGDTKNGVRVLAIACVAVFIIVALVA